MTATILNTDEFPTELRVFHVGNDSEQKADADLIIPGDDLTNRDQTSIDITRRIQDWKDSGTMAIKSDTTVDGKTLKEAWSSDEEVDALEAITSGDRVEFWVSFVEINGEEAGGYGEGGFGEGGYGGGFAVHSDRRWTAYAHSPELTADGPGPITIVFDATDFVFEVLSSRRVTDAFEDEDISGSDDAIIETVLADEAPEIDRSKIEDVGTKTDREFGGRDVKEMCVDLAETADALMASEGTSLIFKPYDDISVKHSLDWDDVEGTVTLTKDDQDLVNDWRVDGGTGVEKDEVQETVDGYTTVTESNRIEYELDPEKNRLSRIDVWTKTTGSEEDVSVRIQAPNSAGDGPRDPGDTTKDIVGDRSSHEFLADDGWRERFRVKNEPLPDNPWLIIESGGEDGQDIGVNSDGDPAIRTYYPYPINVQVSDQDSIDQYRLREDQLSKKIISTFDMARDVGDAKLRHSKDPEYIISCRAQTLRAHLLEPGEVVDLDLDPLATGNYLVVERGETYDAETNRLETELTLQDLDTF